MLHIFKEQFHSSFIYYSEFTTRMESRSTPMPSSRKPPVRSSSNESQQGYEKTDGSQSDSALGSSITEGRTKRRPSLSHKMASFVGLRRRSSSANQLAGRIYPDPQIRVCN